ncbi:ABC transporter ATP-binding protein [Planotetraspora thailandica]|uniref:ABC transporter ATP-binding protein n=1 Tax=Planotetraspora thailandica TaxID=487172 RepID=A0A8J3V6B2_9ACTN|nr:ATP-binding cassette domain-containing protein [Planotetraspora thailandica]GII57503.1 ABC transporter ATP-binding protein [Planotetraspora thailandica]
MIVLADLTKRYGEKTAVDHLSFQIQPGVVTGFLGPNGAGKSSTMRMILGLDRPTAGTVEIAGRPYRDIAYPLRTIGALLDPRTGHPGQSARSHLLGMARSNRLPSSRVDHVLGAVGLAEVARKRIGSFSLGMGQRLGIASALLGDPQIVMLDEPVNGLDPDGVVWIRKLMRSLAAEGRTVFVSSHLMSEMQETADHLIVIGRGALIADAPIDQVIAQSTRNSVKVRSPQTASLREALERAGMTVTTLEDSELQVTAGNLDQVGAIAFSIGAQVDELAFHRPSLEQAYLELTADSLEYDAILPRPTGT